MNRRLKEKGFTLIELLVVIAIIALLISILLPAIGRARKAAQMAVSMSNLRQVNIGCATYRDSNKDRFPLFVNSKTGRGFAKTEADVVGWCTWSFAGKNNSDYWATGTKAWADVEAADRPLNPYIYEGISWEAPDAPTKMPKDYPARKTQQAKVFQDPSDKVTHQRAWPAPTPAVNCYDDVGTSYQFNTKWWDQVEGKTGGFLRDFEFGIKRMALADSFNPSKYAWVHDEYADIIVNAKSKTFQLKNGYDDVNKSLLGFLDGHTGYVTVIPGKDKAAYSNDKYTFIFEDLKLPS